MGLKPLQSIYYRPWPLTLRALGRKRHKRGGGALWGEELRPRAAERTGLSKGGEFLVH